MDDYKKWCYEHADISEALYEAKKSRDNLKVKALVYDDDPRYADAYAKTQQEVEELKQELDDHMKLKPDKPE